MSCDGVSRTKWEKNLLRPACCLYVAWLGGPWFVALVFTIIEQEFVWGVG
jgi:hypothetical protein